jgi:hypothetical protein
MYYDDYSDLNEIKEAPSSKGFELAALVCGILSLAFFYFGVLISIPCAAFSILFALLSKRTNKMPFRSKVSIVLSVAGICLSIAITCFSYYVLEKDGTLSQVYDYLDEYMENGDSDNGLENWYEDQENDVTPTPSRSHSYDDSL